MPLIKSPHKPIIITITCDVVSGESEVKISQPVNPLWLICLFSQILNGQIIEFSKHIKPSQTEAPTNGGPEHI